MTGLVTMLKAGCGEIRGANGIAYLFTREGEQAGLDVGQLVEFDGVARFSRWRARNVQRIPSTSSTTASKGASA
jgi:hypothetical protein